MDYFNKVSNNILLEVEPSDPIQPATRLLDKCGRYEHYQQRVGKLPWIISIEMKMGFRMVLGGNATFINNVVKDSPFTILTTGTASGSGLTGATINGMINGYPIGSFYMQKFLGIGSDGLSIFEESEDAGRMVVGSALPDVMYNFYAQLGI